MSKPNLLAFSSSVGIYRNKRMMDLQRLLSKSLPGKVERSNMATMFFQVVMAYAAENQIDGNFDGYTPDDWSKVFVTNNVPVTPPEASAIIKGFRDVGLFDGDKIRSWNKYNRHLADYERIVKAKRKAAKRMHDKWDREAANAHSNNTVDPSKNGEGTAPKPVQKASQKDSTSKDLFINKEALEFAQGKERRSLLIQRKKLLSDHTGVDLSTPRPSPAPSPGKPPRKLTAAEQERESLVMAQTTLADYPDGLSENMVTALVNSGHKLPGPVKSRFRDLIAKLQADNPVPE